MFKEEDLEVQGYLVIQAPEIINCSSYSGDHMNEENRQ